MSEKPPFNPYAEKPKGEVDDASLERFVDNFIVGLEARKERKNREDEKPKIEEVTLEEVEQIEPEVLTQAMRESQEYLQQRYQRAQRILLEKEDKLQILMNEAGRGFFSTVNPERVAEVLGLGDEDRTLAVFVADSLDFIPPQISQDPERFSYRVLSKMESSKELEQAMAAFLQGKGWYFETEEGKSRLAQIKSEIADKGTTNVH